VLVLRYLNSSCYSTLPRASENCVKVSDLCQFQDLSEVLVKIYISRRITGYRRVNCY